MLAIAFEGCACRAAFHVGVAEGLAAGGMTFPLAAGSSSGSLVAAGVAADLMSRLPSIWMSLAGRRIVSLRRVMWNRSLFDMSHIVRGGLREVLGAGDLRSARGEALVVATRLQGLNPIVYSSREEEDFVEPLMGSCFLPPFYGRPVRVDGKLLVDGGFSDNLPIEALVRRGASEVVAVVTSPSGRALKSPRRRNWIPTAEGAIVHVIRPAQSLPIGAWDFRRDRMAAAIDAGRAAAARFLAR